MTSPVADVKSTIITKRDLLMKDLVKEFDMGNLRLYYAISGAQTMKQIDKIKDEYSRKIVLEAYQNFMSKTHQPCESYVDYYKNMNDEYELFDSLDNDIERCCLAQVDAGLDLYRIILAKDRSWICGWKRIPPG